MVLAFINDKERTVKQIKFLLNKSVAMPGTFVGMKPNSAFENGDNVWPIEIPTASWLSVRKSKRPV